MDQKDLELASEAYIRSALRKRLPKDAKVYIFGSRARQTASWNSDYDFWVDAFLPDWTINEFIEELDESFVPFKVDVVTTPKLRGRFGECVRAEAKLWM